MDLAGVAQKELDINNGMRSIDHVMDVLEKNGCKIGSNNEYQGLLKKIKEEGT
jgi:hypothetical protein